MVDLSHVSFSRDEIVFVPNICPCVLFIRVLKIPNKVPKLSELFICINRERKLEQRVQTPECHPEELALLWHPC